MRTGCLKCLCKTHERRQQRDGIRRYGITTQMTGIAGINRIMEGLSRIAVKSRAHISTTYVLDQSPIRSITLLYETQTVETGRHLALQEERRHHTQSSDIPVIVQAISCSLTRTGPGFLSSIVLHIRSSSSLMPPGISWNIPLLPLLDAYACAGGMRVPLSQGEEDIPTAWVVCR